MSAQPGSKHEATTSKHESRSRKPLTSREESPAPETSLATALQRLQQPDALHSPSDLAALQQLSGNRATTRFIQAKLHVGPAGDAYEQEADQVADRVLGMSNPLAPVKRQPEEEELQLQPLSDAITPLQRQPEEELQLKPLQRQPEEELQLKPTKAGGFEVGSKTEERLQASRGGGTPLPAATRSFMEPRFGASLGGVRVHTDANANQMAQRLQAKAFTHGRDIYFARGHYNPGSTAGKRLIAHELTHTLQQSGGLQRQIIRRELMSSDTWKTETHVRFKRRSNDLQRIDRALAVYHSFTLKDQRLRALNDVYAALHAYLEKQKNEKRRAAALLLLQQVRQEQKKLTAEDEPVSEKEGQERRAKAYAIKMGINVFGHGGGRRKPLPPVPTKPLPIPPKLKKPNKPLPPLPLPGNFDATPYYRRSEAAIERALSANTRAYKATEEAFSLIDSYKAATGQRATFKTGNKDSDHKRTQAMLDRSDAAAQQAEAGMAQEKEHLEGLHDEASGYYVAAKLMGGEKLRGEVMKYAAARAQNESAPDPIWYVEQSEENAIKAEAVAAILEKRVPEMQRKTLVEGEAGRVGLGDPQQRNLGSLQQKASDAWLKMDENRFKIQTYFSYLRMDRETIQGHVNRRIEALRKKGLEEEVIQHLIKHGHDRAGQGQNPLNDPQAQALLNMENLEVTGEQDQANLPGSKSRKGTRANLTRARRAMVRDAQALELLTKQSTEAQHREQEAVDYYLATEQVHTYADATYDEVTDAKQAKSEDRFEPLLMKVGQVWQNVETSALYRLRLKEHKNTVQEESKRFKKYGQRAQSTGQRLWAKVKGGVRGAVVETLSLGLRRGGTVTRGGGYRVEYEGRSIITDIKRNFAELKSVWSQGKGRKGEWGSKIGTSVFIMLKFISQVISLVRPIVSSLGLLFTVLALIPPLTEIFGPLAAVFTSIGLIMTLVKLAIDLILAIWAGIASTSVDPRKRKLWKAQAGQHGVAAVQEAVGAGVQIGFAGVAGSAGELFSPVAAWQGTANRLAGNVSANTAIPKIPGFDVNLGFTNVNVPSLNVDPLVKGGAKFVGQTGAGMFPTAHYAMGGSHAITESEARKGGSLLPVPETPSEKAPQPPQVGEKSRDAKSKIAMLREKLFGAVEKTTNSVGKVTKKDSHVEEVRDLSSHELPETRDIVGDVDAQMDELPENVEEKL